MVETQNSGLGQGQGLSRRLPWGRPFPAAAAGRATADLMPHWLLAISGVLVGAFLEHLGFRIEGGAVPVLAIGPLFLALDRELFPGLLLGPLFFTYLFHFLGYGLGPLWQVHVLGGFEEIEAGFVPAQWGGALGLWTYAIAFPLIFRISSRAFERNGGRAESLPDQKRWETFTLALLALVVFIIVFGVLTGSANRLGNTGEVSVEELSVTAAVPAVGPVLFFFLGYLAVRRRGKWRLLWLLTLVGYVAFYWLDGGRGAGAFAVLMSAMGYVWGGMTVRRVLGRLALFTLLFIPVSGIVLDYRDLVKSERLPGLTSFQKRINTFSQTVGNFSADFSLARASGVFFRNVTAHAVDRVFLLTPQEIPFAGLEGIENIPSGLVPRIIDPDKPNLADGNDLAILYGSQDKLGVGGYMPAVGDGYRRFGWLGVALLYVFSAAVYAPVLAWLWARRVRCEWLAMILVITVSSGEVFSTSVLRNFYFLLWIFPKYLLLIWLFGKLSENLFNIFIPMKLPPKIKPNGFRRI